MAVAFQRQGPERVEGSRGGQWSLESRRRRDRLRCAVGGQGQQEPVDGEVVWGLCASDRLAAEADDRRVSDAGDSAGRFVQAG